MKFSSSGKINKALYDMGIFKYEDALFHLPRKYENLSLTRETNLDDKERIVVIGEIVGSVTVSRFSKANVTRFSFVSDNKNLFMVEAWNRPYLNKILNNDDKYTLIANYDKVHNKFNLINIIKGIDLINTVKPIYSLHHDIDNYWFSNFVKKAFELVKDNIKDDIPIHLRNKYRLLEKSDALYKLHFPKDYEDIRLGQRVLKYEECLNFSLRTQIIRESNKQLVKENNCLIDKSKIKEFIQTLPYKLTKDQKQALLEIVNDLDKKTLMYRLLQGDVGTGKTLVAALALFANHLRNDQGALMAPTDSLARQHYKNLTELFKNTNIRIGLLLGSSTIKDRSQIRNQLMNKEIDIIVGTHILFSKDINYLTLGLAVIDEQHKFGVNQRSLLASKGSHADLLLMSATPIPRSLALTLYGDLDVSTLSTFPCENRNIKTIIVSSASKKIDQLVQQSLNNHKRVFVVAPAIEEGNDDSISVETLFPIYLLRYPGLVNRLHGKLSSDEKNFILQDFYSGKKPILISTTVIEVGIDVKNADLMIIYDSTHFGLASLHQLRGRIGRDGTPSTCVLVNDSNDEDDLDKLNVLVKSNDGFYIAEEDLRRRGPGELLGMKQSGSISFNYVNLVHDFKMFECARDDAKEILSNPNDYDNYEIVNRAYKSLEKEDDFNALA